MLAKSVDNKSIKKTAMTLVLLAVAIAAVGYGIKAVKEPENDTGAPVLCGTTEEREQYLASIGIQVATKSTVAEVLVPEEFDQRFCDYDIMQQAMGFGLEGYKGQCLKKCVYTVTNREDLEGTVSAVLLVKDNYLVGGHLLLEDTGDVLPLYEVELPEREPETAAAQDVETILPAPAPVEEPSEPSDDSESEETFYTDDTYAADVGAYPTD